MNDIFPSHEPDASPDPRRPRLPWPAWSLVNGLSLGAMLAANSALPSIEADALFFTLTVLFIVGPALAAGSLDGRWRAWATVTVSGWAFLGISLIALTFTESWQRDCGLGQGFTLYFAGMGALLYPVVTLVTFGLGKLVGRFARLDGESRA